MQCNYSQLRTKTQFSNESDDMIWHDDYHGSDTGYGSLEKWHVITIAAALKL